MPRTITLGSIDFTSTALGVNWRGLMLQGWDGSPESTQVITQKPRDAGGWSSEAFLTSKVLVLTGMIAGDNAQTVMQAADTLNAAVDLVAVGLTVTDDGIGPRTMKVARQGAVVFTPQPTNLVKVFSAQLVAKDPRKYGPTVSLGPVAPPSSSGGLTFPITFPITFPAVVTSGVISFPNPGNVAAPCTLRIDGPCTGPVITHIGSGAQLVFSASLTVNSGEYLIVDMAARTARLMGQASRIGYVTSRGWFNLDPGANDITYNATGGTLTVTGPQGAWQ